jgi:thiol-disulfide isomerase/thioredoxin
MLVNQALVGRSVTTWNPRVAATLGLALIAVSGATCTNALADAGRVSLVRADAAQLKTLLTARVERPRLVHVWASWCFPCRVEWPALAGGLRRWNGEPIDILTIALEEPDTAAAAERVLREVGEVPGRGVWASAETAIAALRALDREWDGALPLTLLLTAKGKVVVAQRGITKLRELEVAIERLGRRTSQTSKPAVARGRNER